MSERLYLVTLEIYETKTVQFRASDHHDAVNKAREIADSGEHGDARVDWVHELLPVHHG